jgi:citrate synthase
MPKDSLTVTDNRTDQHYHPPIADGAVHTIDLRQVKTDTGDFGLMGSDPAFMNTASRRGGGQR